MKVALLLPGQARMFKSAYPYLKESIIDPYKADVYISTWYNPSIPTDINGGWRYEDEGSLQEYLELYQPERFVVHKYDEAFIKEMEAFQPRCRQGTSAVRMFSMYWQFHQAMRLVQTDYDVIVKARADLKIGNKLNLEGVALSGKMGFDYLYTDCNINGAKERIFNDLIVFGNQNAMTMYCSMIYDLRSQHHISVEHTPLSILESGLNQACLKLYTYDWQCEVIRPKNVQF